MSKEKLALVVEDNPEPVINTDSLTYYLLGMNFLWSPHQRFAKYLNLGFYTPKLIEFHNERRMVDIHDEEQKNKFLSIDFGDTTSDTSFARARKRIKETALEFANVKGESEDSLSFYYDLVDYQIKSVRSEPGSFGSTPAAIFKVLDMDNCVPLIEVHKHPEDSFFSAQDYHPVLTKAWKESPPLCNAVLLLCPNIQVLSLATFQTPVSSQKDAEKLFKPVDENLLEGKEIEHQRNMKRISRLIKQRGNIPLKTLKSYLTEAAPIEAEMAKQGATSEEIYRVMKEIAERYRKQSEQYLSKIDHSMDQAAEKMLSLLHKTAEGNLINFARSICTVSYISRNFRDFYQFSA
ncbi:MAG: hypothetical protein M1142_02960 [Patescibacteria group bacterium]|nr:hypothetical protein [Patescibacteria group bacterium]